MSKNVDVAVFVGSLRKESIALKMARALVVLAPAPLRLRIVAIGALPLYNQDWESDPPAPVREFRDAVRGADAVLFVTPEYNRSVPGVLKNAIDVGSRPSGKSIWSRKPGAVISISPGRVGGFGANHHLRQSMVFLDVPLLQQPEMYIGNSVNLFDDHDALIDESTRDHSLKFLQAYARWIARTAEPRT